MVSLQLANQSTQQTSCSMGAEHPVSWVTSDIVKFPHEVAMHQRPLGPNQHVGSLPTKPKYQEVKQGKAAANSTNTHNIDGRRIQQETSYGLHVQGVVLILWQLTICPSHLVGFLNPTQGNSVTPYSTSQTSQQLNQLTSTATNRDQILKKKIFLKNYSIFTSSLMESNEELSFVLVHFSS